MTPHLYSEGFQTILSWATLTPSAPNHIVNLAPLAEDIGFFPMKLRWVVDSDPMNSFTDVFFEVTVNPPSGSELGVPFVEACSIKEIYGASWSHINSVPNTITFMDNFDFFVCGHSNAVPFSHTAGT